MSFSKLLYSNRKKIHINICLVRNLLFYIILFPYPIFEQINNKFDLLFKLLQGVVLGICIFGAVIKRRVRFGKFEVYALIFCLFGVCINGLLSTDHIISFAGEVAFPIISTVMFGLIFFQKDYKQSIHYIAKFYSISIWINFLFMLLFPHGLVVSATGASTERACWLFGSKNNIIHFLPQILLFMQLDISLNKRKNKGGFLITMVILIISVLSMGSNEMSFLQGSATATMMILIALVVYTLNSIPFITKLLSCISIRFVTLFSFGIMMLMSFLGKLKYVPFIQYVVEALGKDLSFSGRNTVWTMCIKQFMQSPIYGNGQERFAYFLYGNSQWLTSFEYSFWISIIVRYGLLGLGLIFLMFFSAECKKNTIGRLSSIFRVNFLLVMIAGLLYVPNWEGIILILMTYVCVQRRIAEQKIYEECYDGKKSDI